MSMRVLVYDLPSENQKVISLNGLYEKVRNLRVNCVRLLHSLGIQCTESVILISPEKDELVNQAIQYVINSYSEFERNNNIILGKPLIRVLQLTTEQTETFLELARRNLLTKLDETIDRVSRILDEIDIILSSDRVRSVRRNILRLKREWNNIRELAESLGIDISRDLQYLIDLIDKAIDELRGAER